MCNSIHARHNRIVYSITNPFSNKYSLSVSSSAIAWGTFTQDHPSSRERKASLTLGPVGGESGTEVCHVGMKVSNG